MTIALLRLLQLADSALPVGSTAHSFGLETLAAEGVTSAEGLFAFFREYLAEVGAVDAAICVAAHRLHASTDEVDARWIELCDLASALKPARESREASGVLGRRLLALVATLEPFPVVDRALAACEAASALPHYAAAFGIVSASFDVDERSAAVALLHQEVAGLVSACQRCMPVGQFAASQLLWDLKPAMIEAVELGLTTDPASVCCFTPILDAASMRHRRLPTRLFIS